MMTRPDWSSEQIAELAPCPFCGEPPTTTRRYVDTGSGDGAMHYGVACQRHPHMMIQAGALGVHGYRRDDDPASDEAVMAEAIAAWNARAPR